MPTIDLTTLRFHPAFSSNNAAHFNWVSAHDFTVSETELFKVPSSYTVWVYNEEGEKFRHYKHNVGRLISGLDVDGKSVLFVSKKAAEMGGFKFSFRMNMFMKEEDARFYGTETQLHYHSNARTDYSLPEDEWKVGLEVEKEDERYSNDVSVWKLFQETGWAKERDGSLGMFGYELISPILPLWDRQRLKKAMRPVKKYLDANQSRRCGGHVNVSCKGKNSRQVLNEFKAGAALLYAIYENRLTNHFCHVRHWENYELHPEKYSAFYCKNAQVMEIRLLPAVKSMNNLMWRVDLVRWLVQVDKTSFVKKIQSLKNENGFLKNHLRKIFSDEKILQVAQKAIKHYQQWIAPLTEEEKAKLQAMGFLTDVALIDQQAATIRNSNS